jgi:hypothetical protein
MGPRERSGVPRPLLSEFGPLVAIRAGLHTGEIEVRDDKDVGGIAVNIASRVSHLASSGEVFVSSTVKDLVAGSGLIFDDLGLRAIKGFEDELRIFAARWSRKPRQGHDFRFGSNSEVGGRDPEVRFSFDNGLWVDIAPFPFGATTGLMHRNKVPHYHLISRSCAVSPYRKL